MADALMVGLISQRKGLLCRAGGCNEVFHPVAVPMLVSVASRSIKAHDDALLRAILEAAQLRNKHELAAHNYDHGNRLVPKAQPFQDNNGHRNKTLRWDLLPS